MCSRKASGRPRQGGMETEYLELLTNAVLTPQCRESPGSSAPGTSQGLREVGRAESRPPRYSCDCKAQEARTGTQQGAKTGPGPVNWVASGKPPLGLPSEGTCHPSRPGHSLCKRGAWSSVIRAALSPGHLLGSSRASQPETGCGDSFTW